jgi:ABC-type nitrate/sulfonate/bicarbonate transport system permease component
MSAPAGRVRGVLSRARRRASSAALPLLGLVVVLAAFELAPRLGLVPRRSVPPVSEVFAELGRLAGTAELWTAVRATIEAWCWAMLIAVGVGVPLGLAMGANRVARLVLRATVEFLRPIPSVALIPILLLLYGSTPSMKVALGAFGASFPLLFQAMYGIADVDPVATDTGRAFGLSGAQRLGRIVLPNCAPYLATGLRISASIALILVVTGEYVGGAPGLGEEVFVAESSGSARDRMYALIVVAGVLGVVVNLAFHAVERRALFWHPSHRPPAGASGNEP